MNFIEHFMDEALGSRYTNGHANGHASNTNGHTTGYTLENTWIVEQGNYLCIHEAGFPLHVYRLIGANEEIHPTVAQLEHNGRSYRLELIEDDKW